MHHTSTAVVDAVQRRLLVHTARDIGPKTFGAFDDEGLSDDIGKARNFKHFYVVIIQVGAVHCTDKKSDRLWGRDWTQLQEQWTVVV